MIYIKRITRDERYYDPTSEFIIPTFGHQKGYMHEDEESDMLREVFGKEVKSAENILWCLKSKLHGEPILSTVHYSNDATAISLLPSWSKFLSSQVNGTDWQLTWLAAVLLHEEDPPAKKFQTEQPTE